MINWCILHTYFWKYIFKQQYKKYPWTRHNCWKKKNNNKRNTVWKLPCYLISKYKTSTNNLLQDSKKSVLCFVFVLFFYFFIFFSKTGKIQSSGVNLMDDSLPSFHLLKDPLACKPRRQGPVEECSSWVSRVASGQLKPGLGKPLGRPR